MGADRTDEYYRFYALREDPTPCSDWFRAGLIAYMSALYTCGKIGGKR